MRKNFYVMLLLVFMHFQAKCQENTDSIKHNVKNAHNTHTSASTSSVKDANINSNQGDFDSVKFTITNMGRSINTPYDEFCPVISADGSMMAFTSNRPILDSTISDEEQTFENVYVSYFNEYLKRWTKAKMLGKTINQPGKNNSLVALSNDGQRMLMYRGDPDGDLYESDLTGNEWSEPFKLPEPINSSKQETSASISPDGRTIYFVSDRKGGQGGLDIWQCRQDIDGNWGKAENLGPEINTPLDEEGVFIHPDGKTLYFSSKGHNSKGGYDVFNSVFENGKWSNPASLGDSINTINDDLFFVVAADGKTGYYSSIRPGGIGKKDIYKIGFTYLKKKKSEPRLTLFKGIVLDYDTFEPLGADIEVLDNDKNEIITRVKSNSVTGRFLLSLPSGINYGIGVKRKGYLFYPENFNIPDTSVYKVIDKHIPLEKIKLKNTTILNDLLFETDKATLLPRVDLQLNQMIQMLILNNEIKAEIESYTDNVGSDESNLKLSQERAQSLLDFFIHAGVSESQLKAIGYGNSNPIAPNSTQDGRHINQRTRFKAFNK